MSRMQQTYFIKQNNLGYHKMNNSQKLNYSELFQRQWEGVGFIEIITTIMGKKELHPIIL